MLPEAVLRMRLHQAADWKKRLEDGSLVKSNVPTDVLKAVHQSGEWQHVRGLIGVTSGPVLRSDGTLLLKPGYDAATRLFSSCNLQLDVPDSPSAEQTTAAVHLLFDLIADFNFGKPEHASAAISGILTVIARPAIHGPVPATIYDANMRGSGKTILARLIADVALGRDLPARSAPKDSAEWNKTILTVALAGDSIVLFDNAKHAISSEALEAALTSSTIAGRNLGVIRDLLLPFRALVVITSNNATLSSDLVRRSLHVRLESPVEHPERLGGFKYPRLREHAREHRAELLSAAFTILRRYLRAGKPDLGLTPMGSFQEWSDLVRAAMVFAGFPDPVASQETLQESADDDRHSLEVLLHAWRSTYGDRAVTAGQALIDAGTDDALAQAILGFADAHGALPSPRQFGNVLKRVRGAIVCGMAMRADAKTAVGLPLRVVLVDARAHSPAAASCSPRGGAPAESCDEILDEERVANHRGGAAEQAAE